MAAETAHRGKRFPSSARAKAAWADAGGAYRGNIQFAEGRCTAKEWRFLAIAVDVPPISHRLPGSGRLTPATAGLRAFTRATAADRDGNTATLATGDGLG